MALLLLIGSVLYYEFVVEPELQRPAGKPSDPILAGIGEGLVWFVPAVLVFGLGTWWLLRRALDPLNRLTEAVERIHAGNLHERVEGEEAKDEVGRLASVFNGMMRRLD